ncbi:MAG: hypothetical protein AAFR60_00075 [Pseudomonadota bacterium]
MVGITAFEGLQRAGTGCGQTVLVHGGSGGVGHIALQLTEHFGAEVCATCSDDQQASVITGDGATPINCKSEAVADPVDKHTVCAAQTVTAD